MNLLFRYIFREIVWSALIGAVLFTFILFLRSVGPVMELLLRPAVAGEDVALLFLLTIPQSLRFTIPMGVLVGVLIGLGRLSADGEIIAMRAAGVSSRKVVGPVLLFSLLGGAVCAAATLWINPLAQREFQRITEDLRITSAHAEVQPRVFIEGVFPNRVLYVRDVIAGAEVRWKGVFLADTRAPSERGSYGGAGAAVDGPRITIAEEAIVIPRPEQERLQLHLPHAVTYEQSFNPKQYFSIERESDDQVLEAPAAPARARPRPFEHMSTRELAREAREGENRIDAGIVFHQRFALPLACLILPLAGIPLSVSSQRAGRSTAVIFCALLAFAYWMLLLTGTALAKGEILPVGASVWLANGVFAVLGGVLLWQLDAPNRRDFAAAVARRVRSVAGLLRRAEEGTEQADERAGVARNGRNGRNGISISVPFFPIVDRYILRMFLFYLVVFVAVFVSIWFVFSFFELLTDMLERGKLARFIPYIYYLTPFLIYQTAPLGVLFATLALFGVLGKHYELTAFRACGISLYRLGLPVVLSSFFISGLLFGLDQYYLPETNRRQDAIRDEIKGRPPRTYLRHDRKWTYGLGERIYNHGFFDSENNVLAKVNVYDFGSEVFRLQRHISAERARWDRQRRVWVFENGWARKIEEGGRIHFEQFDSRAFPDLVEDPEYFLKEDVLSQQMNWRELGNYIRDLTQAGFDTVRLKVQWHKKLAFPSFALAMALLAVPFSMVAGHRGALSGVTLSLALAIAYYAIDALFEQLGRVSQLTPLMAAWAPSLAFGLTGGYLFLRVRS